MKIKILGSAPGLPTLGKSNSLIWLRIADKNVLLDCGEGASQRLLQNNLIKDSIDLVLISHLHPDHVSGIFMMIQMFYLQGRTKPLNIYLPERVKDFAALLEMFYTFADRLTYKVNFLPIENANKECCALTLIDSDHLISYKDVISKYNIPNTMQAYSFLFTENNKRFIYSADISDTKKIEPYLDNTDLLVVDAFHVTAKEIIALPQKTKGRIILNHGLSDELKKIIDSLEFELADEETGIIL